MLFIFCVSIGVPNASPPPVPLLKIPISGNIIFVLINPVGVPLPRLLIAPSNATALYVFSVYINQLLDSSVELSYAVIL